MKNKLAKEEIFLMYDILNAIKQCHNLKISVT